MHITAAPFAEPPAPPGLEPGGARAAANNAASRAAGPQACAHKHNAEPQGRRAAGNFPLVCYLCSAILSPFAFN